MPQTDILRIKSKDNCDFSQTKEQKIISHTCIPLSESVESKHKPSNSISQR